MKIKIHQVFYEENQKQLLDNSFIPLDNIKSKLNDEMEYPLLLSLFEENKDFDGYWGMVSFRWREKVERTGDSFIQWMRNNPGYNVYFPDTHPAQLILSNKEVPNIFAHGEKCHPGMIDYFNRLCSILGHEIDFTQEFPSEYMIFAHYYFGNKKFWNAWIPFLNNCIEISKNDSQLYKFMYETKSKHRNYEVKNFCFVVERLAPLFLYTHKNEFNVLRYVGKLKHVPNLLR